MIQPKTQAVFFSVATLMAIAWPVHQNWKKNPKDNFPLSYYPMFSHQRKATHSLPYFVGYDNIGNRYFIPYKFAGTGGFNQVRRQINKRARSGDAKKLTRKVAKALRKTKKQPFKNLVRVEMVRGKFHLDDYFNTEKKQPIKETVYHIEKIERK